jgi:hypothetical protein
MDYWTMAEHMTFWQWLSGDIIFALVLFSLSWLLARIVYRTTQQREKIEKVDK